MDSRLAYYSKDIDEHGNIVEMKIWAVKATKDKPHGLKYSLVYIVAGIRIVGYDNAEQKGDHRHFHGKEHPYKFLSVEKLFEYFKRDIKRSDKS
jgi:hypothetical protein